MLSIFVVVSGEIVVGEEIEVFILFVDIVIRLSSISFFNSIFPSFNPKINKRKQIKEKKRN